jgi:hypothetical protein
MNIHKSKPLVRLMVRVSPEDKKAIRKAAREGKVSDSQVVREALAKHLKKA